MFPEPGGSDEDWDRELTPKELRDAKVSLIALAALMLILSLFFTGCVNAPVAPNLKLPEAPPVKECPRLKMPAVPDQVHLVIEGDMIEADEGGDTLLRGYVRARSLLK
jgi:hypothetical protein